ncbi:hypothetical protein PR002_g666 [Phytophthora rubi]|uniref:Uncharacterized protein n=1 Tax=Phytophthora rubi TaxID=129364 RepID=A0A6A3NRR1_9STRA|nr:hypothetical protein PR002_g666 [Phytophthora rubi]
MPVVSKNSRRNNRPATRGRAHQSGVEDASVSPNPAELELSISSLSSTTETVTSAETITSTETLTPGETIALAETSETSDAADPTGPPRVAPGDESDEEIRALLDAVFQGPPPSSPARNDNHQHQRLPVHAQQPDSLQDHVSLQFLPQQGQPLLWQTVNQTWCPISTEFYLGQEDAPVRGLTRDQVI